MTPVFGDRTAADVDPRVSFLELAEIIVAVRFTQHGGKLAKVRRARERALQDYPELQYPFANLRLKQLGGEILHAIDEEEGGPALALSLGGLDGEQHTLPTFADQALELFEFDERDNLACRWFPAGRSSPIVLDPRFAGGRLSVEGRGVTVDTIAKCFFKEKLDIDFIAEDYELDRETVLQIVQFAQPAA